jgi:hypothetical protein
MLSFGFWSWALSLLFCSTIHGSAHTVLRWLAWLCLGFAFDFCLSDLFKFLLVCWLVVVALGLVANREFGGIVLDLADDVYCFRF